MKNKFWVKYRYVCKPDEFFSEPMNAEDTIDIITLAEQGITVIEDMYIIAE